MEKYFVWLMKQQQLVISTSKLLSKTLITRPWLGFRWFMYHAWLLYSILWLVSLQPEYSTLKSRIIECMYIEFNQGFFQCPWGPWTWEKRILIPWKNIVLGNFISVPLFLLLSNHWNSLTLMISFLISQCSLNRISTCSTLLYYQIKKLKCNN